MEIIQTMCKTTGSKLVITTSENIEKIRSGEALSITDIMCEGSFQNRWTLSDKEIE